MKIGFIGTGAYGVALASCVYKNNKNIIMWTENKTLYNKYLKDKKIKGIIDNFELNEDIKLSMDYEEVCRDSKIIFITCAATYVGNVCKNIKRYINKDTIICIASKGIENNSCSFLSDIAKNELNTKHISIISGPSFAIDLVNNNPVGLAIASLNRKDIDIVVSVLQSDTLKLRRSKDIKGIQLCGSIKNVLAIASGILNGLGYSESSQSFLITESLHDVKNLIKSLGGRPLTILSFAGVGDILLTCTSTKSRNYSFGVMIGKGLEKKEIDEYLSNTTVEGYYTLKSIYKLIKNKKIDMPIIDLIYDIVLKNDNPNKLVNFLINKN